MIACSIPKKAINQWNSVELKKLIPPTLLFFKSKFHTDDELLKMMSFMTYFI